MSWIVRVERSRISFSTRIWITHHAEDSNTVRVFRHGSGQYGDGLEVPAHSTPPEDAFFADIPDGAQYPLLQELAQCLGSVEHPLQLRKDFEHERGRVDGLIKALSELALRLGGQ